MALRPRLLDLFCRDGGAAMGYYRAGWDVTGVDIEDRPRYPFPFIKADALTFPLDGFDAIHASPICQGNTTLKIMWNAKKHEDLLTPIRERLISTGVPWAIENVPGAPMRPDVVLCGSMFGLSAGPYQLRRHRWFELSGFFTGSRLRCSHQSPTIGIYGDHVRHARRNGDLPMATGFPLAQEAMGIDWMAWDGLTQAIPPAYTEWLGRHMLGALEVAA